jgi:hypothetical protein
LSFIDWLKKIDNGKYRGLNTTCIAQVSYKDYQTIIEGTVQKPKMIKKCVPIVEENINIDGSSIYMTSTQEIIIKDLDEFPLNSFDTPINTTNKLLTKLSLAPITNNNIPAADQDKNSIK